MDEQKLLKISLICSIVGIGILFFFTQSINPQTWTTTGEQGLVKMTGDIISVNAHDEVTFVTIRTMQEVPLVLFGTAKEHLGNLTKGMRIEVLGKKDEPQGKQGLIVEELNVKKKHENPD